MNGGRSLVGERLDEAWGSVDLQLTVTISFKSGEPRGLRPERHTHVVDASSVGAA
jgi:hypothetical protein